MKSQLPGIVVAVGLVLLLVSALWAVLFPATRSWTDEKGKRMADLSAKAHSLSFEMVESEKPNMHGGRSHAEVKEEFDKVSADLAGLKEELDGKVAAPARATTILRWSGVAFVVAGAIILFANRES